MNFIIFDLEATCWAENEKIGKVSEIIEIGAVKVDDNRRIIDRFNTFVRPQRHPNLSDFCRRLTTISQVDVNRAPFYPEAVEEFIEWIGYYDEEPYLLCSWGFYDRKALEQDCKMHQIDADFASYHISLKHQYQEIKGLPKAIGLKSACDKEDIIWQGTHHRGADDAENLASLFLKYYKFWEFKE